MKYNTGLKSAKVIFLSKAQSRRDSEKYFLIYFSSYLAVR